MKWLLTLTEVGMLAYWTLALLALVGVQIIPPDQMYSDYQNPLIVAWNWSFFPLDVLFAVLGLASRFWVQQADLRRTLAIVSLALMFCAGLMAISFWVIRGWFDPLWWGMNLWLMILPVLVMLRLNKN